MYDRVHDVFPFRNSNVGWRRAGFFNHKPLAGTAAAYDGWSLFVPMRQRRDGWLRTWGGANVLASVGTPVAEYVTFPAGTDPEDPCNDVEVFYSPTASQAFAVRPDVGRAPQVGYDLAGSPVYWTTDDGYRMMGGLEAERLDECTTCPEHPYDATKPRHAWLEMDFTINSEDHSGSGTFDCMPAGCDLYSSTCWDCLFLPNAGCDPGIPQKSDFLGSPCTLTGGVYYASTYWFLWEFCGWIGGMDWLTGTILMDGIECQDNITLPTPTFVGGMISIDWRIFKQLDPITRGGNLGHDGNCNCGIWLEDQTDPPHDECRKQAGFQHSFVYYGSDVCRPTFSGSRSTFDDDTRFCWGDNPANDTNGCVTPARPMKDYSMSFSIKPS